MVVRQQHQVVAPLRGWRARRRHGARVHVSLRHDQDKHAVTAAGRADSDVDWWWRRCSREWSHVIGAGWWFGKFFFVCRYRIKVDSGSNCDVLRCRRCDSRSRSKNGWIFVGHRVIYAHWHLGVIILIVLNGERLKVSCFSYRHCAKKHHARHAFLVKWPRSNEFVRTNSGPPTAWPR